MADMADMAHIERIDVKQAREKVHQALLVCAYENEAKHRMFNLDGSISLANFRSRLASLPKTQENIDILHVTRTWQFMPGGELIDR